MKRKSLVFLSFLILLVLSCTMINFSFAGGLFRPKAALIEMFKSLCEAHPSKASYAVIGQSYENRDIYIFRFGNPNGGAVLWDGSMHGWEDIGSEIEYLLAEWLLTSNTPEANRILERNYVLFIPIVNMDSTERGNNDFSNGATWGVDLNRNFVTGFSYISPPGTPELPYHGAYGGSEPETQAIRNALQQYQPDIYVNTHYGGTPYLQSSGTNTTLSDMIKTRITQISNEMGFLFPWSLRSGGAGSGLAIADGNSFGANSWLWEIASSNDPIGTGEASGPYMHTSHSLSDIQDYFFPRTIPVLRAMCESCEIAPSTPASQYQLTIELTEGKGWTSPSYGVYNYDVGTIVTITAYENAGYDFSCWSVDGNNFDSNNPLQLTMNANHVLKAMYIDELVPTPTPTPTPTPSPTPTPTPTPSGARVEIASTGTIQYTT